MDEIDSLIGQLDSGEGHKTTLLRKMGELKDPKAIPAIIRALKTESSHQLLAGVNALEEIAEANPGHSELGVIADAVLRLMKSIANYELDLSPPEFYDPANDPYMGGVEAKQPRAGTTINYSATLVLLAIREPAIGHLIEMVKEPGLDTITAMAGLAELGPVVVPAVFELLFHENNNIKKAGLDIIEEVEAKQHTLEGLEMTQRAIEDAVKNRKRGPWNLDEPLRMRMVKILDELSMVKNMYVTDGLILDGAYPKPPKPKSRMWQTARMRRATSS